MVDAFYADNNRIQTIHNNDISFDSQRPSIELFTDAAISLTGLAIEFPNFITSYAYYRDAFSGQTICQSWQTILWQEWGPGEGFHNEQYFSQNPSGSIPGPTTRFLPATLLGSVPAETTYLDVRVRLTRTVAPDPWLVDQVPVVSFKEGQWINLPGGSCPCERIQNSSRQFDIVRSGNNVFLERRQSVFNANTTLAPGNNAQANISVNQSGWNSAIFLSSEGNIGAGTLTPLSNWIISHKLDERGPDLNGDKRPNGSNPCSRYVRPTRSVYTGDIIITPGRHRT